MTDSRKFAYAMTRSLSNGFPFILLSVMILAITSYYPSDSLTSAQAQLDDNINDLNDDFMPFDETPPSIKITYPASCSNSVASPGIVVVRGIASDDLSGVSNVEAFSHSYPFNEDYRFAMAAPSKTDWSSWSIPVEIHDTRTRILVKATDNAGNENWDEVIIDIKEMSQKQSSRDSLRAIAFVEPSFTAAAYNLDGFYEFYDKYEDVDFGQNITDDLNLMTADIPADPERGYFEPILQRVKAFVPTTVQTTIIGDTDVHDGFIFRNDGSNAYEALFLLHNEYVTQQEYDNLKRFVSNGGKIVFLDGNLFYGEVSYDRTYCTATLIKGHDWEFDGKVVKRSVSERYFEENREWLGSNYMINSLSDPVYFTNNPFNYTHFEENYVANQNVRILHDYGLTIGEGYEAEDWHRNASIATYELDYGSGKNIVLGIYAQNESNNPAFLDFFEDVVLMHALGNEYEVTAGDQRYSIYWKMDSGSVSKVTASGELGKLVVSIDRTENTNDILMISLPKELIDANSVVSGELEADSEGTTQVLVPSSDELQQISQGRSLNQLVVTTLTGDGVTGEDHVNVNQRVTDHERILVVPLSQDVASVEIYGAYVAPEFGVSGILFLIGAIAIACSIGAVTISSRKKE